MRKITSTPMENGICFHSKRNRGYAIKVTVDEKGEIATECIKTSKLAFINLKKKLMFELFNLPVYILLAKLLMWAMSKNFMTVMRALLIAYIILEIIEILYIAATRKSDFNRFKTTSRVVQYAYRKLGRVPNIIELEYFRPKEFSETKKITERIILMILFEVCTFIPTSWRLLGIIYLFLIAVALSKLKLLDPIQRLTREVPSRRELEVAILGMKEWKRNENEGKI